MVENVRELIFAGVHQAIKGIIVRWVILIELCLKGIHAHSHAVMGSVRPLINVNVMKDGTEEDVKEVSLFVGVSLLCLQLNVTSTVINLIFNYVAAIFVR